jgi:hypothetical protein
MCYKHEILLKKDAKPNQEAEFVRYNREVVITVIVITEFDCIEVNIIQLLQKNILYCAMLLSRNNDFVLSN